MSYAVRLFIGKPIVFFVFFQVATFASAQTTATYVLPSGYALTVNSTGISKVTRGGFTLASGGSGLSDARWFVGDTPNSLFWWTTILTKSAAKQVDGSMRVKQTYGGTDRLKASAVLNFAVSGNDLTIKMTVTNTGSTAWRHVGLHGITFPWTAASWAVAAQTAIGVYDVGRTQLSMNGVTDISGTDGSDFWYPSSKRRHPVFGWRDAPFGGGHLSWVSWPLQDPSAPSVTIWSSQDGLSEQIIHLFQRHVEPGETVTVAVVYRFAATGDDEALLSGFKAHVRSAAPLTYTPDVRPMAMFAHFAESNIRADNPYGYADGGSVATCASPSWVCRRFDTKVGAAQYGSLLVPAMQESRIQGLIAWQPQGVHPRTGAYRPDFNVFPPETRANSHLLTDPFTQAGLKFGFLMRPSHTITSGTDVRYDAYATASVHPAAIGELVRRAQDMVAMGFAPTTYIDSFPDRPQDQLTLMALRKYVPEFVAYTEHHTLASVPYAGIYGIVSYSNNVFGVWGLDPIIRYVYPEVPGIYKWVGPLPPGGEAEQYAYMLSHQLTPLVEDYQVPSHASILRQLVDQYIDEMNRWR
jgi:hypothetical protein